MLNIIEAYKEAIFQSISQLNSSKDSVLKFTSLVNELIKKLRDQGQLAINSLREDTKKIIIKINKLDELQRKLNERNNRPQRQPQEGEIEEQEANPPLNQQNQNQPQNPPPQNPPPQNPPPQNPPPQPDVNPEEVAEGAAAARPLRFLENEEDLDGNNGNGGNDGNNENNENNENEMSDEDLLKEINITKNLQKSGFEQIYLSKEAMLEKYVKVNGIVMKKIIKSLELDKIDMFKEYADIKERLYKMKQKISANVLSSDTISAKAKLITGIQTNIDTLNTKINKYSVLVDKFNSMSDSLKSFYLTSINSRGKVKAYTININDYIEFLNKTANLGINIDPFKDIITEYFEKYKSEKIDLVTIEVPDLSFKDIYMGTGFRDVFENFENNTNQQHPVFDIEDVEMEDLTINNEDDDDAVDGDRERLRENETEEQRTQRQNQERRELEDLEATNNLLIGINQTAKVKLNASDYGINFTPKLFARYVELCSMFMPPNMQIKFNILGNYNPIWNIQIFKSIDETQILFKPEFNTVVIFIGKDSVLNDHFKNIVSTFSKKQYFKYNNSLSYEDACCIIYLITMKTTSEFNKFYKKLDVLWFVKESIRESSLLALCDPRIEPREDIEVEFDPEDLHPERKRRRFN